MKDVPQRCEQLLGSIIVALDEASDDADSESPEVFLGGKNQCTTDTPALPSRIDGKTVDPSLSAIVCGKDGSDQLILWVFRQQERCMRGGEFSTNVRLGVSAKRA